MYSITTSIYHAERDIASYQCASLSSGFPFTHIDGLAARLPPDVPTCRFNSPHLLLTDVDWLTGLLVNTIDWREVVVVQTHCSYEYEYEYRTGGLRMMVMTMTN